MFFFIFPAFFRLVIAAILSSNSRFFQAVVAAQRQLTQDHHQGGDGDEDEILRRRGDPRTLVRRPSYRKILTELGGHQNMINGEQLFLAPFFKSLKFSPLQKLKSLDVFAFMI